MKLKLRILLAALMAALLVPAIVTVGSTGSPAVGAVGADSDDTSVTVQGTGRFSDLKVTVSKTEHLANEVVHISWSGLKGGSGSAFPGNYLQIMQCWGDEPAPDRQKCQFGGVLDPKYGGQFVATRQVNGYAVDPLETITAPVGNSYAPFKSVTGVTEPNMPSQFFGGATTNEQPFGRTAVDGTGEDFFEVQTGREAPGLGCGARLADGKARACWLAIVPRDAVEVDGKASSNGVLNSSPLSQTNWNNRLSVRLQFDPIGLTCPIGSAEKRLLGQEEFAEVITRWQPKLCGETGSIFGFSQVSGDLARDKVLDDDPWLNFVSHPLDPTTVPEGRPITYAPVAISALGIAFNFDVNPGFQSPPDPDIERRRGQRIDTMRLNPRLIAKLLTQSYLAGSFSPGMPAANPIALLKDPEFLGLNPQFVGLKTEIPVVSLLQPLGLADGHAELWAYIKSDADAVAFINGTADKGGMKINPRFKGMSLDRSDFPRSDLGQLNLGTTGGGGKIVLEELNARPFAADMHEVARSAARGDTLMRTQYDPDAVPPTFKKDPLQVVGQRAVFGITDLPTAARFSLPMVALKNAAGKYVTPTSASIRAGLVQMKKSKVDGVLESNPAATDPDAYPLPIVTYAVTSPQQLPADDAKAYAAFLKYAATKGQVPGIEQGKLPVGYVPLPAAMVDQTLAAAAYIGRRGDLSAEPTATPTAGETTAPPSSSGPVSVPSIATPPNNGSPSKGPVAAPVLTGPASSPFTTPDDSAGFQRYLLIAALALGLLAGLFKPATTWLFARNQAPPQTAGGSE